MNWKKKYKELRYRIFSWRKYPDIHPSQEPIDVVIPIISKDLEILPLCLEGVRNCVCHNIKDIYIVAPDEQVIRDFCTKYNLIFIDECSVFGYSPMSLNLIVNDGRNRSGWLFQQFVKLSGTIGTCRYYLCIDADHVLIHPHVFLTDKEETVFYLSYEYHPPYYENIHRLLPDLDILSLSYVDHKMLFDKEQIKKLQETISKNSGGKQWQQAILDSIDLNTISGFSEFETYGNFIQQKVLRPWLQKRLPYKKISDYDALRRKYGSSRWSLTFPDYMHQNKKK